MNFVADGIEDADGRCRERTHLYGWKKIGAYCRKKAESEGGELCEMSGFPDDEGCQVPVEGFVQPGKKPAACCFGDIGRAG